MVVAHFAYTDVTKSLSCEPLCLESSDNFPLFGGLGEGRGGLSFFTLSSSHGGFFLDFSYYIFE